MENAMNMGENSTRRRTRVLSLDVCTSNELILTCRSADLRSFVEAFLRYCARHERVGIPKYAILPLYPRR